MSKKDSVNVSVRERELSQASTSTTQKEAMVEHKEDQDHMEASDVAHTSSHLNAELAAAVAASPIPRWSPATRKLYLGLIAGIFSVYSLGYDMTLMTNIAAMPFWHKQFPGVGVSGAYMSGVIAVYPAGIFLGSPFSSMACDQWGRRHALFFGSIIVIIGTVLTSSATHIGQFMVARIILGVGGAFMVIPSLAYLTEISPPQWRGRIVGLFNAAFYLGSIPCSAICYGTSFIENQWSWRIPHILQALACVGLIWVVPFIPESPRFLMVKGKEEEALEWLIRYHGNGDPDSRLVQLEYNEMLTSIRRETSGNSFNYAQLFATRPRRWRMSQVVMMAFFSQFTGNGLSYFTVAIYNDIGITTAEKQLGYHLMTSILSSIGSVVGALGCDHVARRHMLVGGSWAQAILLSIVTALMATFSKKSAHDTGRHVLGKAALANIVLFMVVQSYTYMCLNAVVPAEALTTAMRARGLSVKWIIMIVMQLTSIFGIGIGLKRHGWRIMLLFIVMNIIAVAFWYFLGIEAQGMTIEELDWVYDQPNPIKAALQARKSMVRTFTGNAVKQDITEQQK